MYVCIVRCTVACRTVAWLGRLCADFVLSDAPVLIFSKPECENFGYVKAHTIPMHSAAADSVALPGRDVMCPSGVMSCAPWHSVSAVASIVERFRTPSAILRRSRRPSAAELYCAILLCAIHPKRCPLKTLGSAAAAVNRIAHGFAGSALMRRTNAEGCRAKGRSSALHSSIGSMRVCEPPTALQVGCMMRMRAYTLMSACSYSATHADSRACRTLLYCCTLRLTRCASGYSWLYDEPLVDSLAALVGSRHSIHL
jgi:hypothetical protein